MVAVEPVLDAAAALDAAGEIEGDADAGRACARAATASAGIETTAFFTRYGPLASRR